MRKTAGILLLFGILGFFYASSKIDDLEPVPDGLSVSESLEYPAARWTLARYGSASLAGLALMALVLSKGN